MDAAHQDQLALSVVIPAFNEEHRLARTLGEVDAFLVSRRGLTEIVVADDGSDDATAEIVRRFQPSERVTVRLLTLPHRGKANAVREGVLAASGQIILFTDADLSTPMSYAPCLFDALAETASIAIGSREGVGAQRQGEPGYRHIMGRVFNRVVRLIAVPGINDTQCGFKAFERDAAHAIFTRTRLHSAVDIRGPRVSGFDVEVLFLARKLGYRIAEIPVYWQHAPGSKVQPFLDPFRMFADVVRVRLHSIAGHYDIDEVKRAQSVNEELLQ